ncbi:MAG: hypothetical protein AAF393_07095 [Pseudomonadota bacterium]
MNVKKFALVTAFSVLAGWANAQTIEPVGELAGEIGDATLIWQTLRMAGHGATATFEEIIPGLVSITVQGHLDGQFGMEKALSVSVSRTPQGHFVEGSVTYLASGSIRDFYESAPGSVTVSVKRFEETSDGGLIEGTAKGTLRRVRVEGVDVNEDDSDTIAVEVTFTSKLYKDDE